MVANRLALFVVLTSALANSVEARPHSGPSPDEVIVAPAPASRPPSRAVDDVNCPNGACGIAQGDGPAADGGNCPNGGCEG